MPEIIKLIFYTTFVGPPLKINRTFYNFSSKEEHLDFIATDFQHAVSIASSPPVSDIAEAIWVMGGQGVYQVCSSCI